MSADRTPRLAGACVELLSFADLAYGMGTLGWVIHDTGAEQLRVHRNRDPGREQKRHE